MVGGHATAGWLSNNVFWRFKQCGKKFKKVADRSRDSGRRSRDRWSTVKQRFFDVSSNTEKLWKKLLNGHATVVGDQATVGRLSNNVLSTFEAFRKILKKVAERSRDSGRRSRNRRMTVKQRFLTFQAIRKTFEKSRWTVTRQWSEVTRPLDDCQTTFLQRFKQFGKLLKKVAERSRDSGRRSRDRWSTVKQRFFDVSSNTEKLWKKLLNGHATVVGDHATVGRLSNNVFSTFKAFRKILKKVAERSRDSGRRSRNRRMTVKQRFLTFQAIRKTFEKSRWTVTRQWSEVTRPLDDCQTTFLRRFKQFGKLLKKVAELSRDSGRR